MEINPIKVSSEFNSKYVEIDSSIYSLDLAKHVFPKIIEEIKKSFVNMRASSSPLKKFIYPSYTQMIKDVENKTEKIFTDINIAKSSSSFKQFENAYKVYNYLANSLKYNMLTIEERGYHFEDDGLYFYSLKMNKSRLQELNLKPATPSERTFYKTKKSIIYTQIAELDELLKETMSKREVSYVKGLYNALIRGEGVCSDFANAYNYLLEKIGIVSYKVISQRTFANGVEYHAYSLVEFEQGVKKSYYGCDLTKSTRHKDNYNFLKEQGTVLGFGIGKNKLITDNHQILSIQKQQGINEGRYYPEIEEEIIEKDLPKNLITKLVAFAEEGKEVN